MKTYEKLLQLGVFTICDVDAFYGNRNSAATAVKSLLKRGLVTRVKKNLYVCNDLENRTPVADKFKIGSCITKGAYISHHSALEFHGIAHQLFFEIYVSSRFVFKAFEFGGITYRYVASKTEEGVESYSTNRGVRVTSLERAVIDCIKDLDKSGGLEELLQCLRLITFLDDAKLMKYLTIYDIQFLYQKTGYILEYFKEDLKLRSSFFEFCQKNIIKSKRYLTYKGDNNLSYNLKWRLVVPKDMFVFMKVGGSELV